MTATNGTILNPMLYAPCRMGASLSTLALSQTRNIRYHRIRFRPGFLDFTIKRFQYLDIPNFFSYIGYSGKNVEKIPHLSISIFRKL